MKIFVFPKDGRDPWLNIIQHAEKTIDIAAYRFSDYIIIQAIKDALHRGVAVNLLMESHVFEHERGKDIINFPIQELKKMGVSVFTISKRFTQMHCKMIISDNKIGLIGTGNLNPETFDGIPKQNEPASRDFAVSIKDISIVSAMKRMFLADIYDNRVIPENSPLVWGPDQQRSTFLRLINSARKSIHIYQQDIQDGGIVRALLGAIQNKVEVKVIMTPFPFSHREDKNIPNQKILSATGAQIRLSSDPYIHAKILIIDGKEMYVGSGNFYAPSIDQARELGILLTELEAISIVLNTFQYDWDNSFPFFGG